MKSHKTRMGHHHCKVHKVTETAVKDAILTKRKAEQAQMPKVMWGETRGGDNECVENEIS